MKKITVFAILILASLSTFAQGDFPENNLGKNDLKLNMFSLIGFKWLDVDYERILNEESTFGIGTVISLDSDVDDLERKFSITPYYRHFFSSKYAQGFFIEAFTMLHTGEDLYHDKYDSVTGSYIDSERNYTDLAVGISVGGKFISRRGFVAEIFLGIGRDMLGNSDSEVVGRGGISFGYRF